MSRLVYRSGFRHHTSSPGLLALSIVGVAIGVALVVGIDAAGSSAQRAFERSADAVAGRTTHSIGSAGGTVDDSVYVRLRKDGFRNIYPVVEGAVVSPGGPLRLLGIDPFSDVGARDFAQYSGDPTSLVTRPGSVVISARTGREFDMAVGDSVRLRSAGVASTLRVVAAPELPDPVADQAWSGLLVSDISTAQEVTGQLGKLSRIDVVISNPADLERLRGMLPPGVTLRPSGTRSETLAQMTRAFQLNLQALSYLALLVGMFLVYNIVSFSVARRRPVLGRLRALGVSGASLRRLVLSEAAALGLAGTVLGLGLGALMGTGLVRVVTRTINDLYFVVHVEGVEVAGLTWVKGILIGLGSTLVAAWGPARRAGRIVPALVLRRSIEEQRLRERFGLMAVLSVGFFVTALALLLSDTGLAGSYAGLLCMIAGFAVAAPPVIHAMTSLIIRVVRRPLLVRMAAGSVRAHLSRTSVAIAALAVAVASAVGVGVMVQSFRGTVDTWLSYALQADVYVQPPSAVARRGGETLRPEVEHMIRTDPEVRAAYGIRRVSVVSSLGEVDLIAVEHGPETHGTFRFKAVAGADPWSVADDGRHVLVSEPFAARHRISTADSLTLLTDRGERTLKVGAIYYDYGSDLGAVLLGRPAFDRLFDDTLRSGLAVFLKPGVDPGRTARRLEARTADLQQLHVGSNAALRSASLEVFDRTFAVTRILQVLAVLVAIVGIITTLSAQETDRAWEFGVLRAVGMGPLSLRRLMTIESGLMGLMAGLLAVPLGLALSLGLVYVINVRSFGWTLQFDPSFAYLVQAVVVSTVSGTLAGLVPAIRLSRKRVSSLLRGLAVVLPLTVLVGCSSADRPAPVDLSSALSADTTGYERVVGPTPIEFPRDHGPHDGHKLEWWYFTGNLETVAGRRFGYQFTIFRSALVPPGVAVERPSEWGTTQVYSAHLAVTDVESGAFVFEERVERGAVGLAGATGEPFKVWLDDWQASGPASLDSLHVTAQAPDFGIDLVLRPVKPIVLQGDRGFSRKGAESGQASMYYSISRLETTGHVRVGREPIAVTGLSWLDREWSTSLLSADQVGWDWFSLQLDDGSDLMYFRLRRTDGTTAFADASIVGAGGRREPVSAAGIRTEPSGSWTSPDTGIRYPSGWRLVSESPDMDLVVTPVLKNQELVTRVAYWEGAVSVAGSVRGRAVSGRGYAELTGYTDDATADLVDK